MFTVPTKASDTTPAGRIDISVGDAMEFGMTFTLQFYEKTSLGNGIERWSEAPTKIDVLEVTGDSWAAWLEQDDHDYISGLALQKLNLEKAE